MIVSSPITEDELHAYVDGRLSSARQTEVEAYLAAHPDVAERIGQYGRQRDALRAALSSIAEEPVPPQLNVRHLLEARQHDRGTPWRSMVASVLLLIVGAAGGWTMRGGEAPQPTASGIDSLAQEAAYTYNVFGADQTHPVEFGASDKAQLVDWISSRIGRPIAVPDLTAAGYHFMGGRVVATAHGAAGLLMYDNAQGERIAMLVRPMTIDKNATMTENSFGDVRGYSWSREGTGFSLVGAAPADLLHPIANEVRRQESDPI